MTTTSKAHRTRAAGNVQYTRDVLPSPPVSPRSSPYSQKLVSATLYQSSPSSFPSVSKPYVTVTETPIAARVYGGSRQTTYQSADNLPPTGVSISDTTEPSPAEVSPIICSSFPRFSFRETRLGWGVAHNAFHAGYQVYPRAFFHHRPDLFMVTNTFL